MRIGPQWRATDSAPRRQRKVYSCLPEGKQEVNAETGRRVSLPVDHHVFENGKYVINLSGHAAHLDSVLVLHERPTMRVDRVGCRVAHRRPNNASELNKDANDRYAGS